MTRLDLSTKDCARLIEGRAEELLSACNGISMSVVHREYVEEVAKELLALAAGLTPRPAEVDKAA